MTISNLQVNNSYDKQRIYEIFESHPMLKNREITLVDCVNNKNIPAKIELHKIIEVHLICMMAKFKIYITDLETKKIACGKMKLSINKSAIEISRLDNFQKDQIKHVGAEFIGTALRCCIAFEKNKLKVLATQSSMPFYLLCGFTFTHIRNKDWEKVKEAFKIDKKEKVNLDHISYLSTKMVLRQPCLNIWKENFRIYTLPLFSFEEWRKCEENDAFTCS